MGVVTEANVMFASSYAQKVELAQAVGGFTHVVDDDWYMLKKTAGAYIYIYVQPVACGMSIRVNLQFQSPWSLLNRTWFKRPRELDNRVRFENGKMILQMQ